MRKHAKNEGSRTAGRWVWLSYVLDGSTPGYGGQPGCEISLQKSISRGDSSNSHRISFSNHLGSHVDAPFHFLMDGRTVASYAPEDWIFTKPALVDVPAQAGTLIGLDVVSTAIEGLSVDTDLLLLRTGHWRVRGDDSYWRDGAGLVAEAAQLLVSRFPSISAIGLDTISLTSYQHREEGRRAHRAFLGNDLRVFEDLSLGEVPRGSALAEVIAMPLRSSAGDGAPCSVIARIG